MLGGARTAERPIDRSAVPLFDLRDLRAHTHHYYALGVQFTRGKYIRRIAERAEVAGRVFVCVPAHRAPRIFIHRR